jgi:hypothetical protein
MVMSGTTLSQNVDSIFVEIKAVKFAQDRSFSDVIAAMILAILSMHENQQEDVGKLITTLKGHLAGNVSRKIV